MIFRDRPDGTALKVPNFKKLNPYMFPTRDESVLFCTDRFNMDEAIEMLLEVNSGKQPEDRINLFHIILTSLLRTIAERPILNTFVAGQRYYRRNEILFSFVAKKDLTDEGEESIVRISLKPNDSLQDVARKIREAVVHGKSEAGNKTEKEIDIVMALPRPFIKAFIWTYKFLDYHNLLPGFMIKTDPIYSTAFFTNLGSIGMDTIYHHLYNWGTCSIFISVGKLKKGPLVRDQERYCQGNQCDGYEDHPGRQGGGRRLLWQLTKAVQKLHRASQAAVGKRPVHKGTDRRAEAEGLGISGNCMGLRM